MAKTLSPNVSWLCAVGDSAPRFSCNRPNLDVLARECEGVGREYPCVAPCMTVFSPVIRRGFFFLEPMPAPRIAWLRNPHFRGHEVSVYKAPPSSAGRRGLSSPGAGSGARTELGGKPCVG